MDPRPFPPRSALPRNGGIYRIQCLANGKSYVGMTTGSLAQRIHAEHLGRLRKGTHPSKRLQAAFNRHGEASFTAEILEDMPGATVAEIAAREIHWIAHFRSAEREHGFNSSTGGEASAVGFRHSEEFKERRRAERTGAPVSDEMREKCRQAKLGHKHTPQHVENNRRAQTGKRLSDETKAKLSAAHTGKQHTTETRLKIGASQIGRVQTEETRAKIRAAHQGMKMPPRTDEHRKKLSETKKTYWEKWRSERSAHTNEKGPEGPSRDE